ncbi:MAG: TetR/AcrR family transcriptional regulator [Actinomycetaceae bacterium]|nr:TetR/AcrR family transcriptional regulator [Actinomycetaceae bacterium]
MARPRYAQGDPRGPERFINAFWQVLATKPYERMTVRDVVAAADMNKNSFYYHFTNLDDLAEDAVADLPLQQIRAAFLAGEPPRSIAARTLSTDDGEERLRRVRLLASRNGTALTPLLERLLIETWAQNEDSHTAALSTDDEIALNFVIGGMLTIHRRTNEAEAIPALLNFLGSALGQACLARLQHIGEATE